MHIRFDQFRLIFLLAITCSALAHGADKIQVTSVDDFTSANASQAWRAREATSKVSYESGALKLELPPYTGAGGEARWPGMARDAAGLGLEKYNGLLIDLTNPTDQTQSLVANFKSGGGNATILMQSVAPRQRKTVKVPFDAVCDGGADWTDVKTIEFFQSRPPTAQTWLIHNIKAYTDDPSRTAIVQLRTLLDETQKTFTRAESDKALSAQESKQAAETLKRWGQDIQKSSVLAGKGSAAYVELTRLQSKLRTATLAREMNKPLLLWSVPTGTRFEPDGAMIQFEQPMETLTLSAAGGQYDDRIVRLTNLTGATQDWQFRFEGADATALAALSARRNQAMVAEDHSVVGDVLVPLDRAGVVTLAPGESAEVWVRIDAKHAKWEPGIHKANLVLQDLRRGIDSRVTLPIEVTIHNFDLAAVTPMHLNVWYDRVKFLQGHEQAVMENLADYGCDVFVVHPWHMPFPKLDAGGNVTEPLDMQAFDAQVRAFRSAVPDATVLIGLGLDSDVPESQKLKANLALYSPQWEKGMHYWLQQCIEHMERLNVPTSDYAIYVTDEPNEDELDLTLAVAKIARSIEPSVKIYVDGINIYYDDAQRNAELMKLTNLWQIGGDFLGVRPTLLSTLQEASHQELWVYQCRTGTQTRQLGADAYQYYRLLSWKALGEGMTGIGYWVYCWDTGKDLWDGTTGGGSQLVYPDAHDGLLMSVRWELVRMSLDDVKYYRLLGQIAEKSGADKGNKEVEALLRDRYQDVLDHPFEPEKAIQWRHDAAAAIEAAGASVAISSN